MLRVWFHKGWRTLSQLRLAVILLALILAVIFVGTLLPQFPHHIEPAHIDYTKTSWAADWWSAVQARYGVLYAPLRALGLFDLFGSLWFQGLVALLALSTTACLLNRLGPLARVALRPRVHLPRERFERATLRAGLAFPSPQAAESALVTSLKRRRYTVHVERDAQGRHLRADRHRLLRLGTLLSHFSLIALLLAAAYGGLTGWRTSAIEATSDRPVPVGHGTGVWLRCDDLQVLRYADGTPQDYRAHVTLTDDDGRTLTEGVVRVNGPLSYAGVGYYLRGYRIGDGGCRVTLQAVHDPGFGPVIAAGLGLFLGVTLTFYFPHRRIWARIGPSGETTLVGSSAWDQERFARQFARLAAELQEKAV